MSDDLRALLIPPQEAHFRSLLRLDGVPLRLITSGWHRLVIVAPDRVFTFPRHVRQVQMLEREADLLSAVQFDFAPRVDPYLTDAPADLWHRALTPVAAMSPATVHGELSEGQFLFDDSLRLTGIVDWDALHVAHPLVDFDLGIGGHKVHRSERVLKQRMWRAYLGERNVSLPDWPQVNLFWSLLDAATLARHAPDDARLPAVLADLDAATESLR